MLWTLIISISFAHPEARASSEIQIADALGREQVRISSETPLLSFSLFPQEGMTTSCKMAKGSRGSIVARSGTKSLVVFNSSDWKKRCKDNGLGDHYMAWVSDDALKAEPPISTEGLDNYGDRCAAYEFLEGEKIKKKQQSEGTTDCKDCKKPSPMLEVASQMLEIDAFHAGNRCLIESEEGKEPGPECSFAAMMSEIKTCEKIRDAKAKNRCIGACVEKLDQAACRLSPWKDKSIQERFQMIMRLGEEPAKRYGVDARVMPCIGIVETGYLEPLRKTNLACINPKMNRYHGLGMITQQTLESYLNPSRDVFVRRKNPANGKTEDVNVGPFRSGNPLINKQSYYACPKKLHDLLGASPELQLEMIAYTMAEKLQATGRNEYRAYLNYNGHAAIDEENGRRHMENYADAVKACVTCLRERYPNKGVDKSVECLSAGLRSGKTTGHPFQLVPSRNILGAVTGAQKRYCGEGE